jgi:AcrR family transcriptional regulator
MQRGIHAMRAHGWRGDPPHDEQQARERIISAAIRCLDRFGPQKTHLADVATELGVTRQTVYRYFANTEDLLIATATSAADTFLDRLAVHVADLDNAPDLVTEAVAYTIEQVPREPYLTLLLTRGSTSTFAQGVTSRTAMDLGRSILRRFPIDWSAAGFADEDLDSLVEFMLRVFLSFVLDPGTRSGDDLRAFLQRWVAPAVSAIPVRR